VVGGWPRDTGHRANRRRWNSCGSRRRNAGSWCCAQRPHPANAKDAFRSRPRWCSVCRSHGYRCLGGACHSCRASRRCGASTAKTVTLDQSSPSRSDSSFPSSLSLDFRIPRSHEPPTVRQWRMPYHLRRPSCARRVRETHRHQVDGVHRTSPFQLAGGVAHAARPKGAAEGTAHSTRRDAGELGDSPEQPQNQIDQELPAPKADRGRRSSRRPHKQHHRNLASHGGSRRAELLCRRLVRSWRSLSPVHSVGIRHAVCAPCSSLSPSAFPRQAPCAAAPVAGRLPPKVSFTR
jgi:hypothetical protein